MTKAFFSLYIFSFLLIPAFTVASQNAVNETYYQRKIHKFESKIDDVKLEISKNEISDFLIKGNWFCCFLMFLIKDNKFTLKSYLTSGLLGAWIGMSLGIFGYLLLEKKLLDKKINFLQKELSQEKLDLYAWQQTHSPEIVEAAAVQI